MGGWTRRQFGVAAAAVGLFGMEAVAQPVMPTVHLPDGSRAPALGQGSWHLAAGRHPAAEEEDALRIGISLGMTLLDTAEMYGNGRAEQLAGRVVTGQREKVFLVFKVWPSHATAPRFPSRSFRNRLREAPSAASKAPGVGGWAYQPTLSGFRRGPC